MLFRSFTDFFIQVKPFIAFYAVYNLNFRISEKHEKKIAKLSLVCAFLLLPVGLLNPGGGTLMDQFGGYSRYATIMIVLGTTYIIYSRQYRTSGALCPFGKDQSGAGGES